jgi:drug/metabolite transporter (DMT)-like permease
MTVAGIEPPAEMVHWWFATGFLILGLLLVSEALVGPEVWARRPWRRYLWPSVLFAMGVLMFPVMTFFTNSTIHMVAHGSWAQVMMLAGAAELGVVRGKLHSPYWRICSALGLAVSGVALLVHEQNHWLFSRAAFLHHTLGWLAVSCAAFPLLQAFRPRSLSAGLGFATTFVLIAVLLYCDRDTAPIFGHLSFYAGVPHR